MYFCSRNLYRGTSNPVVCWAWQLTKQKNLWVLEVNIFAAQKAPAMLHVGAALRWIKGIKAEVKHNMSNILFHTFEEMVTMDHD